jgi:hypothetical protein
MRTLSVLAVSALAGWLGLGVSAWAEEDPDFELKSSSIGNLFMPQITLNRTTVINNVDLELNFSTSQFRLVGAEPDRVIHSRTMLNGSHQIPSMASTGSGIGVIQVNRVTKAARGSIIASGLSGVTMAHVHEGAAGSSGPPIITLLGQGQVWVIPEGTVLTDEQYAKFNNSELYFNVHTSANPGGEIRGQLRPHAFIRALARLSGANSSGQGVAVFTLNSTTRELSGGVTISGLADVTAAHIHELSTGAVVIPLGGDNTSRSVAAGTVLTEEQMRLLLQGRYYVNVHTSTNPTGEIKGELHRIAD